MLLSLLAVVIGIASSLIPIVMMKVASVLRNLLWRQLPGTLRIAQDSPLWIIGVLMLADIAAGSIIRFSQSHAEPDPVCESLINASVPPSALPGPIVVSIPGLVGGVSLGPERSVIAVSITLAVAIGARLLLCVNRVERTILTSARAIGTLFDTPVAAVLVLSQTLNGSSEVPLWDRLFTPLMAAAAGALTTGLFSHPHFLLPITHHGQAEMTDILNGAIVAAIAIVAEMVAVWCLPRLHAMIHQMENPALTLGTGGFILGTLGVIGGPVSLFKGLDKMQRMVADQAFSTSGYSLLAVTKFAALVVAAASGFRDGRTSLTVFVGAALGLMLHEHAPTVPAAIAVSCTTLGIVLMVIRGGWLSLFMAAIVVPNTTLLPLLYIAMLPAWLLLAGKPIMMVNRPKQQSSHDSV